MKYNSSLIKKYITINDTPEAIAQQLVLKTCEIEDVHIRTIPTSVVIWQVVDLKKHPEADKLHVCSVDCWAAWKYEIICWWTNVIQNILVPVAIPWCYLPAVDITIEPRPLKGIMSHWMICSKQELGINEDIDTHRIWDLKKDFSDIKASDVWTPLVQKYPRLDAYIYEVENKTVTHRPDLTWHFWLATELFAIYGPEKKVGLTTVKKWYKTFRDTPILATLSHSAPAKRNVISKTNDLRSYILLELNDISTKASTFFTRLLLTDLWSHSISNWVDFSNLFMNLTWQPVHFFDADKVDWDIIVRHAKDGELFTDLFDVVHTLTDKDIVITDEKKILALWGIVWGKESWISETTKHILVEIANFDPVAVRKTWTRLWLRTDAELRYEKNINPVYSLYCLLLFLDELTYFKKDLGTYTIWWISSYVKKEVEDMISTPTTITIDYKKLALFVRWKEYKEAEKIAKTYLEWLGYIQQEKNVWNVPCWRSPDDMNIVEDLYEEVARMYWFDAIDNIPLMNEITTVDYTPEVKTIRLLEDILVRNLWLQQTESYPWIGKKIAEQFWFSLADLYSLKNPITLDAPYLRPTLVTWLLPYIAKNCKFFDSFGLFDIWSVWERKHTSSETSLHYASEFTWERKDLCILLYQKGITSWDKDLLLKAKEYTTIICKQLWLTDTIQFTPTQHAFYHPNKQADIVYHWICIWHMGTIHPLLLKDHKIPETADVVSLSFTLPLLVDFVRKTTHKIASYETLQDQIIWRDLCFVIDEWVSFWWILTAIRRVKEVADMQVFDVYTWSNLPAWKKSVSLKIKIVWDGTMTTEQINEIMNKSIMAAEKAGWTLRS